MKLVAQMDAVSQEELFLLAATWINDHSVASRRTDTELDADTSLGWGDILDPRAFVERNHCPDQTTGADLDMSQLDMDPRTVREDPCLSLST